MILMADLAVLVLAMSLGIGLGLFYFCLLYTSRCV